MGGNGKWQFWIDRGGTFTDVVALDPSGKLNTTKLLSENPEHYEDAAIAGIRRMMETPPGEPVPAGQISSIKMGTTVATNALLERKGARVAFVTTRGFGDALLIGTQNRPRIFALEIEKRPSLPERVIEVNERMDAQGCCLQPLDTAHAREELSRAFADGIDSVAICLMHAYHAPDHERVLADIAAEIGCAQISISHKVSPLIKFVGRGDTTVVDAYLSPVLRRYVRGVVKQVSGHSFEHLYFMQSNGGLVRADLFEGKDAVLSGPAGGVVGMVETARRLGYEKVIGFDMGGTSTDVSHYGGAYERAFDSEIAGVRLRSPMMRIHTVAAGGGSLLTYDGARMRVGPQSAGADPGPACYRKGGPLTVTDANLMLGKLTPDHFPKVFGPHADEPLDREIVRAKFAELAVRLGDGRSPEDIADGFIAIAVQNMAQAIKNISVARGYDVSRYILNCFGGAGAQHACLVADALSMIRIMIHPQASLLSAYGIGLADIRAHREISVELPLTPDQIKKLETDIDRLGGDARAEILGQTIDDSAIEIETVLHLKYEGTDTSLPVPFAEFKTMMADFDALHRARFGFSSPGKPVVIETLEVEGIGHQPISAADVEMPRVAGGIPDRAGTTRFYSGGAWKDAAVVSRAAIGPKETITGPALIIEPHSMIVVEEGWWAQLAEEGSVILSKSSVAEQQPVASTEVDPVQLEIFNNRFMGIAEQMGFTLQNTARSVNIKERLDFSCAVFDAGGGLVANAPHVPVHLGSMGVSVRAVMAKFKDDMSPGDVFVLNDPFDGGTHLPDITVVLPVYDEGGHEILFFTAARGHHADIGGISPGSMPALSTRLDEEGVVIRPTRIVAGGRFQEQLANALLGGSPYPARNPAQNIADLQAQIASCQKGAQELEVLIAAYGLAVVRAYMGHVQQNAEDCVRRVIDKLKPGRFEVPMDDGSIVRVRISLDSARRSATVDFTGMCPQVENNFNAPPAIARAAVLYVFRCLVADDIPLNEGCLEPIDIILPRGCMLNPVPPAAVVAGNVETSQHITDALFGALGVMAAAQGTMNNLTFGNARYQYYETICGGAGAGNGFDGASAVHTHMTNSRLTDPEILEWRFPVLVRRFCIRTGSGGAGLYKGGDGVVRELTFREKMTVSLLTTRRITHPFGLEGGQDGLGGRNRVERANGHVEQLKGCDQFDAEIGDTLIIETPGGGGFGIV